MNKPIAKLGKTESGEDLHYSAGAVIKNDKGEILLIDRATFPFGFACPAGHVDEGETAEVTVVREVKEETGLDVTKYELIRESVTNVLANPCSKGVHHHYWYVYTCEVTGEVTRNLRETKSIGWYSPEEIRKLTLEPVWEYWFKELGII